VTPSYPTTRHDGQDPARCTQEGFAAAARRNSTAWEHLLRATSDLLRAGAVVSMGARLCGGSILNVMVEREGLLAKARSANWRTRRC